MHYHTVLKKPYENINRCIQIALKYIYIFIAKNSRPKYNVATKCD